MQRISSSKPQRVPLPKLQLFLIILIQVAEPVSYSVIYPFINQLIRETGITKGDERKTGYYAGIIESVFFIMESITVVWWSRLADYFGRRPILLLGMVGIAMSMIGFGLSKTFLSIFISRCAQGVFNGNIGVSKTVMAEISSPSNMAQIFGFIPLMWAAGTTVGPIMGGVLSRPADRWQDTLGKIALLREYPYFLPCAAAASVSITSFILSFIGMKETLPLTVRRQKIKERNMLSAADDRDASTSLLGGRRADSNTYGTETSTAQSSDSEQDDVPDSRPPSIRALLIPRVMIPIITYAFLTFSDQCYQVLMPLMWSSSIPLGGLGLTPFEIGVIMGIFGFTNGIIQVIAFSRMVDKFGVRTLYTAGFVALMCSIGAYPLMSFLAKRAGRVDAMTWTVLIFQLTCYILVFMCYGCSSLIFIDAAPGGNALSTVNGLGQMVASTMRSFAPSVASSLFSVSLERHLAGGYMVYWILWAVLAAGIYACSFLPKYSYSEEE